MIFRIALLIGLTFGIHTIVSGQSTRDVATPKPPAPKYQASKKSEKKEFFLFRIFQKDKKLTAREESEAFRKRLKRNARKKARKEKKALKPQFSDPLYFGHKKPPKKRKNGNKKFCKECGLKH